jgi:hypothetical protein
MKAISELIKNNTLRSFGKYFFWGLLLFLSLASVCFRIVLSVENKPFFYINF